jgi:hypothetical protein
MFVSYRFIKFGCKGTTKIAIIQAYCSIKLNTQQKKESAKSKRQFFFYHKKAELHLHNSKKSSNFAAYFSKHAFLEHN